MITPDDPVAWDDFLTQLSDAHEHLGQLLADLANQPDYGEEELRVDLGHVFAHLNRAWNRRNTPGSLSDGDWETFRAFPSDLEPLA